MTHIKGIFSASLSILKDDLSLDIDETIQHAKEVDKLGAGPAFLGSTSQAQLISVQEKKNLILEIAKHKFENPILIGTGSNSLNDNINLMQLAIKNGLNKFLLMNPAYYQNEDSEVYKFFKNIIKSVPKSQIVLYNFNKLSGYTFSANIVKKLVKDFPLNIIGMKDSSGNLWDNLKIANFSMFVGSEIKLLQGLKMGCVGCISATTNVTNSLARTVYDDFINNKEQTVNEKLCAVRKTFDETGNLISALHSFMSLQSIKYKKLLPPLSLLSEKKHEELIFKLKELHFSFKKNMAA